MSNRACCSVTVAFNPDLCRLRMQLAALNAQVDCRVVVDNGSIEGTAVEALCAEFGAVVLRQSHNIGLAKALNEGLTWVESQGYSEALLLDDDSIPGPGMVEALRVAQLDDAAVAARGPRMSMAHEPFGACAMSAENQHAMQPLAVDMLFTSGTLVSLDVIRRIGLMREDLFIDLIDWEWCMRARSKGLRCLVVPQAIMEHRLGIRTVNLWLLRKRRIHLHSPTRNYYMARNALLLFAQRDLPLAWRTGLLVRSLRNVLAELMLGRQVLARARSIVAGLWDGMRNIGGALPPHADSR